MEMTREVWAFVVALAAVVNGLGIVRLIGGFGDYLRKRHVLEVEHYLPFTAMAFFQLLTHALLWWSILGLKSAGSINFLSYLYLILGPTLLFLATSMLVPDVDNDRLNIRADYYRVRRTYYSVLTAFWTWAIFIWPVFGYPFAPSVPFIALWLGLTLLLLFTDNPRIHAFGVACFFLVFVAFVALFAMKLGEVGRMMTNN